ncbi:type II toxin-antitoxin system HipA family toxin [Noviherbaspirillum sp.]|uniref:type II toxin-antitoxin system HipA family toxin n=1 Tax=Noviherbaspirillum sp. TaxID=1926288 RepID=UPI002FDF2B11
MNKKIAPLPKTRQLHIHCSQGYSGLLTRESQIVFNYATDRPECEISLTMPLRAASYTANILPGVLRQNLPEGYLLNWLHEQFGKTMKMDDFNILALTGKDMIGRVRCSLDKDDHNAAPEPEDLKALLTWRGSEDLFEHLARKYAAGSGVSGVQPKVLVSAHPDKDVLDKSTMKDKNLIVKSGGHDYPGLAENEYHCMRIGKLAGLATPAFWLSENRELFIIERFDIDAEGRYLGFEDMTALTGRQNSEKYDASYETATKVIDQFASAAHKTASLTELFKSIVLSVAVRNGDAHLKNFGLLYTTPQTDNVRLAPLYDIVNTTCYLPKDVLALRMAKTKSWPSRETLIHFGRTYCRIDRPELIIDHIAGVADSYVPDIEPGDIWALVKAQIAVGSSSIGDRRRYSAVHWKPEAVDDEIEPPRHDA